MASERDNGITIVKLGPGQSIHATCIATLVRMRKPVCFCLVGCVCVCGLWLLCFAMRAHFSALGNAGVVLMDTSASAGQW